MAEVTANFFKKSLGEGAPANAASARQLDDILEVVSDKLSVAEKSSLNAPLTLEELGEAARHTKKLKCPGPDGIPAEFYQSMWTTTGPLLLKLVNEGIEEEKFASGLTLGMIVLLPKKNDQRLLSNKRPITLLNTAYKIAAKVFQNRLTPILQKLISPQQFAFLLGRNIQHSLLLLGEMLHQAEASGDDFVLLKLDVVKAFDRLEWDFLLKVVQKAGMSGSLSGFLKAGFATASSFVMLNGKPTESFMLKRSVRQGCPLSPLLFIVAFDVLSALFQRALDTQAIRGVFFPNIGSSLMHNMYADNLTALIRALIRYILEFKRILIDFGNVSGLHCAWELSIASYISGGPPPPSHWLFLWTWEENANASTITGIPVAETIAMQCLEEMMLSKLESKLSKLRHCCLTLAARVVVANGLVLSCLWFLLMMWAGKVQFLKKLQGLVDNFIWTGRSRVTRLVTTLPKSEGGLGLISIIDQHKALSGSIMIWVTLPGPHPLRCILQVHISQLSTKRWGTSDLSWLVTNCGHLQTKGSSTWRGLCHNWESLWPLLLPQRPANIEEWRALPIWRQHLNHRHTGLQGRLSKNQQRLREAGLISMDDILTPGGQLITWEAARDRGMIVVVLHSKSSTPGC